MRKTGDKLEAFYCIDFSLQFLFPPPFIFHVRSSNIFCTLYVVGWSWFVYIYKMADRNGWVFPFTQQKKKKKKQILNIRQQREALYTYVDQPSL